MLKFIIGFERNPSMSRAQCHQHLRTVHGPLVAGCPEFARYVRRYVQNYSLDEFSTTPRQAFIADGVAELWFDSAPEFLKAYAEPRYLERVRPDEARFTNPGRYVAAFTREQEIWSDPGIYPVKLIRFLAPKADRPDHDARRAWSTSYLTALARDDSIRAVARRYIQSWSIPHSESPFPLAVPYSGVDEVWFSSVDDAEFFCEIEVELLTRSQELAVMDPSRNIVLLALEGVMPGYG